MIFRALIACMILCLWSSSLWATDLIDAEWLDKHLNDQNIRIVDVSNNPDSYETGHIAGAVKINRHVDLADTNAIPPNLYPTKEQFEKLMPWLGIDKDTIVVAYDDKFGIYAGRFLVIMELYGHDINKLKLLNGGMIRWKKLGFPVNKDTVTVKPTKYEVETVRLDIFVSWRNIYRDVVRGTRPDIVLLDSRPTSEYTGKEIRSIRGGHIPKAVNVTGTEANREDDHTFKPLAEIRTMYESKGITPDKVIYEYCHSGDRSAHAYIILRHLLGYKNMKFNDGGWAEWSSIISLPVENEVWLWEASK
jgi:thiosulfate/3-mercaptopyruvate sulfurtransferase